MEWFRVLPVRFLADVRRHALTLEEQGFILQLCAHAALFDGALQRDPESLRAELRPPMPRKRFDTLWARVGSVALSYLAEVDAQADACAKKSSSRRVAAHARWRQSGDAHAHANASTVRNANASANAYAEENRIDKKRSPPTPPKGAYTAAFERFWSVYPNGTNPENPRKGGKIAAFKAWRKLDPDDALLGAMLAALSWQRDTVNWTKDGGAFIPNASTWLNGRRWEDERPTIDTTDDDEPEQDIPHFRPDRPRPEGYGQW